MKFLCDNCKAKYQIPDEKITGRTLRMKCRKCDHDIIIRGETAEARPSVMASTLSVPASAFPSAASQLPIARSRTSGTGVPPRATNALGADFQRRVAAGASEVPAAAAEAPKLWHVAINDVPVGPIRRDEMAKKIGTGEVTAESLCWREGFDDWRPVSEVADLASLLDQRRPPAIKPFEPPAPQAPAPSTHDNDDFDDNEATVVGASPLLREMQEREEREEREREEKKRAAAIAAAKPAPAAPPAREPSGKVPVAKRPDSTSGVARPAPAPVPAPKVAAAAPAVAEAPARVDTVTPSPVVLQPVVVPPAAAPSVATPTARPAVADSIPPAKKKKPLGVGAWMGIAGTFGFGVTMAIMIGRSLSPQPVAPTPAPVVATATPDTTTPAARTDLDTDVEGPVADPSELTPTPTPTTRPTGTTPHPTTGTASTRPATNGTATAPTAALTAEQRALIERMGASSSDPSPTANITVPTTMDTASGAGRAPLSASDLGAVVNRNKIQLQRCHERALRGMSSAPAVRMDVSLSVSAAGTVTTSTATGTDFGGLKSCIEQTVRRWRFPESSGGGATRFPVVFQAVN